MKKIIGIVVLLIGWALGLYLGGYLLLVKGIIDFVYELRVPEISTWVIGVSLVKIIVGWVLAWIIINIFTFISAFILSSNFKIK